MDKQSNKNHLPIPKAVLLIFLSVVMITGTISMVGFYIVHYQKERMKDPHYRLVGIVQTTPHSEMLKTDYLAELLQLNIESPQSLFEVNCDEAKGVLEACPLIKKAQVKPIPPGTLHVDYELRMPIAYLGDFTNTAIDREGVLIPFHPFFTPKKLPVIYIGGMQEVKWGERLSCKKGSLAFNVLEKLQTITSEDVESIDVSRAFAKSMGKREVIVKLSQTQSKDENEKIVERLIRLSTDHAMLALEDYDLLCEYLRGILNNKEGVEVSLKVIDMRIPSLAYIQE